MPELIALIALVVLTLVVVGVPVEYAAVEKLLLGVWLDEKAFAPMDEAEADAARSCR